MKVTDSLIKCISNSGATHLQVLSYISSFIVLCLYFFSPDDQAQGIPSAFGGRYLWSPLILSFIGISISLMMLSGFFFPSTKINTIISINLVFILIIMSPQFAEPSPFGVDGWWFLELADRYALYGVSDSEGYTQKMIVLIPLEVVTRILPNSAPLAASLFGLFMCIAWITLSINQLINQNNFQKWGIPAFTFIAFIMVAWWCPLMYSAQLLGLIMCSYILHYNPNKNNQYLYIIVLLCISATHIQSAIIVGIILFIESFLPTKRSEYARYSALMMGLFFILWNFTVAENSFRSQFGEPGSSLRTQIEYWHILLLLIFGILISHLWAKYGVHEENDALWGDGIGTHNISIILGCIFAIPLMAFIDFRIGEIRLTPRLLAYSIVPLTSWGIILIDQTMRDVKLKLSDKNNSYLLLLLTIFASILSPLAHESYASRTYLIPDETLGCWDMAEDNGLVGLIRNNPDLYNTVIHSPITITKSTDRYFGRFIRLGDESSLDEDEIDNISAVLQTVDMDKALQRYDLGDIYQNWTLVGEIPGACRFWVKPSFVPSLDNKIAWELGAHYQDSTSATR